jgi:hypothetical protein
MEERAIGISAANDVSRMNCLNPKLSLNSVYKEISSPPSPVAFTAEKRGKKHPKWQRMSMQSGCVLSCLLDTFH